MNPTSVENLSSLLDTDDFLINPEQWENAAVGKRQVGA
jgi:hypothetical protein